MWNLVTPGYGFDSNRPGLNLEITARKNDRPIYVDLDSDKGGLGACENVSLKNDSRVNTLYPGSDINRWLVR